MELEPARRPNYGRSGRPTRVRVNLFQTSNVRGQVYHYDVTIQQVDITQTGERPEIESTRNRLPVPVNREIVRAMVNEYQAVFGNHVAYDGRAILYSLRSLDVGDDGREFQVQMNLEGRTRTFLMLVRFIKEFDLSAIDDYCSGRTQEAPLIALAALEVIMGSSGFEHWFQRGRTFYMPRALLTQADRGSVLERFYTDLRDGKETWGGIFQSFRPTGRGLLLNVDMSIGVFTRPQSVLGFCCELFHCRDTDALRHLKMGPRERRILAETLSQVQVQLTYGHSGYRRKIRINGISDKPLEELRFQQGTNTVRVVDYYRQTYNVILEYTKLPALICGRNKALIPLELCDILPTPIAFGKLKSEQTAQVVKASAAPPDMRRRGIQDGVKQISAQKMPLLDELKIGIDGRMLETDARILNAPSLLLKRERRYNDSQNVGFDETLDSRSLVRGSWDMRGRGLFIGTKVSGWAIIIVDDRARTRTQEMEYFAAKLAEKGIAMHMDFPVDHRGKPVIPPILKSYPDKDSLDRGIKEASKGFRDADSAFILFVVGGDSQTYGTIKRLMDSVYGLRSQCMLNKHVPKKSPQYLANILLKINAKLGGANWAFSNPAPMFRKPSMVIGVDVTHPVGMDAPSIAAVVASVDQYFCRYTTYVSQIDSRSEFVSDFEDTVKRCLRDFYEMNHGRYFPENIVVFRDGVSDGQLGTVLAFEVTAMKKAISIMMAEMPEQPEPKITYIVAQKKHHVRMFPASNEGDRNGNVVPGTVIDRDITHPFLFDFYLNSHAGLQGTNRSTHYFCILNEAELDADAVQELCYHFCYVYARCPKAISQSAPVTYADLLAYRARLYCSRDLWNSDTASMTTGGSSGRGGNQMLTINPRLAGTLFFA